MADDDAPIRLLINGKLYTVVPDDLELGEIEEIEDVADQPIEQIDFNRAKNLRALVYVLLHRENDLFTMDDAREIKMSSIKPAPAPEEKPPAAKRPTAAAKSG